MTKFLETFTYIFSLIKKYPYVFIALLLLLLVYIYLKSKKPKVKGDIGEQEVNEILKKLPKSKYKVLNDVFIETKSGTSQIDHIVVSIYGIFVIETKMYSGWIYGDEDSKTWTQNIYNKRVHFFQSPLHQNDVHIRRLKEVDKSLRDLKYFSEITFSEEAELKNDIENVVYFHRLKKYIKSFRKKYLTKDEVKQIYKIIKSENITNPIKRKNHVKKIKEKYEY
ncbi:MAG: NERD domain-containing protein [Tissierellia bacterium]|nr:NERD domain-containing protein [Tissierellia bacterium]